MPTNPTNANAAATHAAAAAAAAAADGPICQGRLDKSARRPHRRHGVLIVGGGLAGQRCAEGLRRARV